MTTSKEAKRQEERKDAAKLILLIIISGVLLFFTKIQPQMQAASPLPVLQTAVKEHYTIYLNDVRQTSAEQILDRNIRLDRSTIASISIDDTHKILKIYTKAYNRQ